MKLLVLLSHVAFLANAYRLPENIDIKGYICGAGNSEYNIPISPNSGVFVLTSTNYHKGEQYSNNQTCNFIFETGEEATQVTFVVEYFDVEYSYQCFWDSLCALGYRICGTITNGEIIGNTTIPVNSTSTVSFISDSSLTFFGFKIFVLTNVGSEDNIIDEDRCATGNYLGIKSFKGALPPTTTWETYNGGYPSQVSTDGPPYNNPYGRPAGRSYDYYGYYKPFGSSHDYYGYYYNPSGSLYDYYGYYEPSGSSYDYYEYYDAPASTPEYNKNDDASTSTPEYNKNDDASTSTPEYNKNDDAPASTPRFKRYNKRLVSSTPEYKRFTTSTPEYKRFTTSTPEYKKFASSTPEDKRFATSTPEYKRFSTSTPECKRFATSTPEFKRFATSTPEYNKRFVSSTGSPKASTKE